MKTVEISNFKVLLLTPADSNGKVRSKTGFPYQFHFNDSKRLWETHGLILLAEGGDFYVLKDRNNHADIALHGRNKLKLLLMS